MRVIDLVGNFLSRMGPVHWRGRGECFFLSVQGTGHLV